jgi:hypothetical protein
MEGGIALTLKKIVGTGVIAGALGLSTIGLAGVANAAPPAAPGAVQHVQLDGWHGGGRGWGGPGWHGGGRGWGGPGWRGPGWGGPGWWGGPPPPPCPLGICI